MAKYTMNDRINFVRSMINDVTKVSNETGISLEFILAQTALETGWGAKVLSGTNNLFNIKADSSWTGPTATFKVREYINGEWVYVESKFRVYSSYEESIKDWLSFLQNNPRYSEVFEPNVKGDLWKIAQAMENAGYATDPKYAEKIIATAKGPTMRNALYYYNNACWTEIYEPYQSWLDGIFNPTSRLYTTAMGPIATVTRRDPAMIDLDGDGIETTDVKDGAYFDHDGNGFSEQSGWAASDDGLLVMDRDGNGTIDSGKELFGDQTILSNGQKAANGFEALREQDSNADGKIDANDAAWSQIKVWQDADGDGYSTVDELHILDEVGIKSINLTSTPNTVTDPEGNTQTRTGSFEKTDGTTGAMGNFLVQRGAAYAIIPFLAMLIIGCLLLIPQNAFSITALNSDPYSLILQWKPKQVKEGANTTDCDRKAEQLAKLLGKTKACQLWENYWFKEMDCAVKSGLTPDIISFCWQYNNNSKRAELFYQTLKREYSKKQCDYDDYYDEPIPCFTFVEKHIARLRFLMDYSKFPSDTNVMVDDLLNSLKKRDKNKILSFFAGREKETIDYEPGAPICDIKTLINERMPDTFSILYKGYQADDPMNPRRKGERVLPCIQAGSWKGIGVLSFQLLQIPPRLGEPPRYYYIILHGGCIK